MKKLLLFIIFMTTIAFYQHAQSSIASIPGFNELFNLSVEQDQNGDLIYSGAYFNQTSKAYISVVGRMDPGHNIIWSREIFWSVNTTFVVSDHVILPSGNIALAGTAGQTSLSLLSDAFPIVLMVDPNGNALPSMGSAYVGNTGRKHAAIHKIIYSDYSKSLIVTGSFNSAHPLVAGSIHAPLRTYDREVCVMSIDANTLKLNWVRTLDTGKLKSDLDYADTVVDLGQDGIFVSGSLSNGTNPLLLIARLDHSGSTLYAHGIDAQSRMPPFAADAILYDTNILLLTNDEDNMRLYCINPLSGQVNDAAVDDSQLVPAGKYLRGHKLLPDPSGGLVTITGYLEDINPTIPTLHPFRADIDIVNPCNLSSLNALVQYFDANNSTQRNHYYHQLGGNQPNYTTTMINTPDMSVGDINYLQMIGWRDNDKIEVYGAYPNAMDGCANRYHTGFLPVSLANMKQYQFIDSKTYKGYNQGTAAHVAQHTSSLNCQSDDCPVLCPVTVQQDCGIDYTLSINCLDNISNVTNLTYAWSFPGLSPGSGSTSAVTVTSLGGNYNYTLVLEYDDQFGTRKVCQYTGIINIPDFSCHDLLINESLNHVCDDEFELNLDIDPNCLPYSITDVDLIKVNIFNHPTCTVLSNQTGSSHTFDLTNCGYGNFELRVAVEITDGTNTVTCYKVTSTNTTPPLVGPYILPIEDECVSSAQVLSEFRLDHSNICFPSGSSSYLYAQVTDPVGPCYEYYWNGSNTPSGPIFICCDQDPGCLGPISLRIVDTCNCCADYDIPNIYDSPLKKDQEKEDEGGLDILTLEQRSILNKKDLQLKIYPNPSSDHIVIDHNYGGPNLFEIVNSLGRVELREDDIKTGQRLSISHLQSGEYFIKIKNIATKDSGIEKLTLIKN